MGGVVTFKLFPKIKNKFRNLISVIFFTITSFVGIIFLISVPVFAYNNTLLGNNNNQNISKIDESKIKEEQTKREEAEKLANQEKSKREEAEKIASEEKIKRENEEKSKKELETKIAQATTINVNYDVGNDLEAQDVEIVKQANLAIAPLGITTQNQKLFDVISVVDGDTIKVNELGTLRLIGIDTPETKDPRKTVQCFGKEASNKASEYLAGKKVYLEFDPANRIDKYGRTLAYIYREDGFFYNSEMIKQGFAHSYIQFPHPKLDEFNNYQKTAKESQIGFWSANTCNGDTTKSAEQPKQVVSPTPTKSTAPAPINDTVYYANCTAVRAAGKAPIYKGQPGYSSKLDRDGDGIGCEK